MSMTAAILLIYAACLAGAIASPPSSGPRTGQAPARRPPAALLALALLAALAPPLPARAGEAAPRPVAGPATVIDGATLEIGGRRLRLYGIDAPDLGQTCFDARERDYPCGRAAARALAARIGGGTVACEPRGGGVLCRLDGDDLAAWMVEGGYAIADRSVTTAYAAEDERAWGRRLGLWSGVFQEPAEWRRGRAVSIAGLRAFSDWGSRGKLLLIDVSRSRYVAPAGHALLFAVGARPPHDGVRRARRLNLFHDLDCWRRPVRDSQRDRLTHRPHGNDPGHPRG